MGRIIGHAPRNIAELMALDGGTANYWLKKMGSLELWLDADDPSTIDYKTTPSGVDAWIDKSDNGYELTQSTNSQKPQRVKQAINSRAALLFDDAAEQYLEVETAAVTAAPLSVLCVAQSDNTDDLQAALWIGDKDSNAEFWRAGWRGDFAGDPLVLDIFGFTSDGSGNGGAETTSGYSAGATAILSAVEPSSSVTEVYLNGGSKGTNSTSRTPTGADRTAVGRTADTGSPGSYFSGYIAEIIVFSKALSNAERQLVEAYLSYKWGVTLAN